jgi:hypothetical protein
MVSGFGSVLARKKSVCREKPRISSGRPTIGKNRPGEHELQGPSAILDVKPVADIRSIAINRQRPAFYCIQDH